jgi:hypothetical protein
MRSLRAFSTDAAGVEQYFCAYYKPSGGEQGATCPGHVYLMCQANSRPARRVFPTAHGKSTSLPGTERGDGSD